MVNRPASQGMANGPNISFIRRCPGTMPAGQRADAFLNSVDVTPTLLRLCGHLIPDLGPYEIARRGTGAS